jgi:hypothetical protein
VAQERPIVVTFDVGLWETIAHDEDAFPARLPRALQLRAFLPGKGESPGQMESTAQDLAQCPRRPFFLNARRLPGLAHSIPPYTTQASRNSTQRPT